MANIHQEAFLMPSTFLRKKDVVGFGKRLPVSDSTFFRLLRAGKFPQPTRVSERVSMWRASDVDAALEKLAGDSQGTDGGE
jgi:predicted DNA-binding transcriptional regulator AlpA